MRRHSFHGGLFPSQLWIVTGVSRGGCAAGASLRRNLVHRPEVNGSHNGEFGGPKPVISPVRYKWSHH